MKLTIIQRVLIVVLIFKLVLICVYTPAYLKFNSLRTYGLLAKGKIDTLYKTLNDGYETYVYLGSFKVDGGSFNFTNFNHSGVENKPLYSIRDTIEIY
jgi:hypothetical protein